MILITIMIILTNVPIANTCDKRQTLRKIDQPQPELHVKYVNLPNQLQQILPETAMASMCHDSHIMPYVRFVYAAMLNWKNDPRSLMEAPTSLTGSSKAADGKLQHRRREALTSPAILELCVDVPPTIWALPVSALGAAYAPAILELRISDLGATRWRRTPRPLTHLQANGQFYALLTKR